MLGANIMNIKGLITTKDSVFDGTGKSFSEIKKWLSSLKAGFYSINFHPGYYDPKSISTIKKEVDADNIKKIVNILNEFEIELANFNDLTRSHQK